jgi:hypothetical protein
MRFMLPAHARIAVVQVGMTSSNVDQLRRVADVVKDFV